MTTKIAGGGGGGADYKIKQLETSQLTIHGDCGLLSKSSEFLAFSGLMGN